MLEKEFTDVDDIEGILEAIGFTQEDLGRSMKDEGFNEYQIANKLEKVFKIDIIALADILEDIGFSIHEIFSVMSQRWAKKFAPLLRFDSGNWTCAGRDSFPMAAQDYYQKIIKTGTQNKYPDIILLNKDPSTIINHDVPTYWKAFRCGKQTRIVYWWFYGYQPKCDCVSGDHNCDWERVMVVLSEDTAHVAAVTYWQHGGYYTRFRGRKGFDLYDKHHPVVYVGRTNHGSYHNTQTAFQTCCYWEDHRDGKGVLMESWRGPLIKLQSPGGEEWMDADAKGGFKWGGRKGISNHPLTNTEANCSMNTCQGGLGAWGCHKTGCYQQQCEPGDRSTGLTCWHCASGYTDCGTYCTEGGWANCFNLFGSHHGISTYGKVFTISTSDVGLTRTNKGW
jgi:hypothetical protein